MSKTLVIDKFPEIDEFYKTYWGKKPFIVRGEINQIIFDNLVDGDSLAGLALDEDIKSRLVRTHADNTFSSEHGPFDEEAFTTLGEENWTLLVQNVDQYHPETSQLLKSFDFSPRWLMDDIMVSYSTVGGGVGPHTDSYHVFLVQGQGKRMWKISYNAVEPEDYADNSGLLLLENDFDGFETEVSTGDVIYIPPHFAHKGVTTKEAMTFSVGFLGPKISEMLSEYSHYLEQHPHLNARYTGQGLDPSSAAFSISASASTKIAHDLTKTIHDDGFTAWMAEYFSTSTHDEYSEIGTEGDDISSEDLLSALKSGQSLYRPEHIKIAVTEASKGSINLATYGHNVSIPENCRNLIERLNNNHKISAGDLENAELVTIATLLYNKSILYLNNV